METLLVVEDSPEAFILIKQALGHLFKLDWAKSCRDARYFLESNNYNLIILDGSLPDGDGFQLCSLIQSHLEWSTIPVVFLTARDSISDKVMGFTLGADDFISKPFDVLELRARIEAKLRKQKLHAVAPNLVSCGEIVIDKNSQRAVINTERDSRELSLTALEFKLLLLFVSHPDVVMTRDKILDVVWGSSVHVYARSVDTHVSKLRLKLGAHSIMISRVHGRGYKMDSPASNVRR